MALVHVVLLVALTCLHWVPRLRGPIDLRYDGGVYYVLGTALAEGRGYRLLNEPGEIRAVQYPPLLPAVIAAYEEVLGSSDPFVVGQALRLSMALVALACTLATYALCRRRLGGGWALFASVVAALSFHTLFVEDLCFTEAPFGLVTVLFFLCHGSARPSARALTPVLAAAAFALRTAGVVLLVAWAVEALWRRRWRSLLMRASFGAACVLAWQDYVSSVRAGADYAHPAYEYQRAPYQFYNVSYAENVALRDPFAPEEGRITAESLALRCSGNAWRVLIGLGESVSSVRGFWHWAFARLTGRQEARVAPWLELVPLTLLGLAVLGGLLLFARRGEGLLVLYVLGSLGLIALLPWPVQIPRYLVPLTPFLASCLAACAHESRGRLRKAALAAAVLVLALQAFTLRQTFARYHQTIVYPPAPGTENDAQPTGSMFLFEDAREWRAFYAALGWLAANSAPQSVVASTCPHLVWIHTGRKAVMPPFEADPAEAERLLETVPVDYLIVDSLRFLEVIPRYAVPVVTRFPELWEPVYGGAEAFLTIYRRRR